MEPKFERIELADQHINAFVFESESFERPWHFHPEFELTLILESSGIRYVGNNISDFEPMDLVLIGGNLPHCWKNDEEHSGKAKSLVIHWRSEIIHDITLLDPIRKLLQEAHRGLFINPQYRPLISKNMYKILESEGVLRYVRLLELLDIIASKVSYELIAGPSYSYDMSGDTTKRLELVQLYVNRHFKEKIKLASVADHLNMSEQSFSRFFSKTMGKPFFSFLNEYRVNIASRMILETDMQMTEVAYKCGYESLPFFYKQFKKVKGYTPLEFRRMYLKSTK